MTKIVRNILTEGADSFLELNDTPDKYTGQHGKIVKVSEDETELIFDDIGHPINALGDWTFKSINPADTVDAGTFILDATEPDKVTNMKISHDDKAGTSHESQFDRWQVGGKVELVSATNVVNQFRIDRATPDASKVVWEFDLSIITPGGDMIVGDDYTVKGATSAESFTKLSDTPDSYTGHKDKQLFVKTDELGIEFRDAPATATFKDLPDTPADYVGQEGRVLRVNDAGDAIEYSGLELRGTGGVVDKAVIPGYTAAEINTAGDQSLITKKYLTDTIAPPAGSKDAHIYGPEGKNEMVVGFDKDGGLKEVKKWSATDTYASGDVVHHNNSIWWASAPAVGDEPGVSTEWTLYIGGSGNLGNPAKDDQLLSSKTDGTRLWVDPQTIPDAEPPLGNPTTDGDVLTSTIAGVRSWVTQAAKEDPLGNPTKDGDILASTTAGVRSWVDPPTGLEKITESGQTGWRLIGADPANYGDIGDGAIDLSVSGTVSTLRGATGKTSVALGDRVTSSGESSLAANRVTQATGKYSTALGNETRAIGDQSLSLGQRSRAEGNNSIASGFGPANTDYPKASGLTSFNFQHIFGGSGIKDSASIYSAILGGVNNETTTAALRSVVLGGTAQTGTQPDTVYMPATKLKALTTAPTTPEDGTTYYDDNTKELTHYNGAWYSESEQARKASVDNGYYLNGTDAGIDCGNDSSLDVIGAITLFAQFTKQGNGTLIQKGDAQSSAANWAYHLYFATNNTLQFRISDGGALNTLQVTSIHFSDKDSLNVVATWDGTTNPNGMKVYVNSISSVFTHTATIANVNINTVRLGVGNTTLIDRDQFNGYIHKAQVWDGALTTDEIDYLLRNNGRIPAGTTATNVLKLDHAMSDNVWFDESGKGNDGAVRNAVLQSKTRVAPTGLEKITEGGNTGWALVGDDRSKKANIGDHAVDASRATSGSGHGASGRYSECHGVNNSATADYSWASGTSNVASGSRAFAHGLHVETVGVGIGTQIKGTGVSNVALINNDSSFTGEMAGVNSAALGGQNSQTTAAATESVIIGGYNITATQERTVYVPSLVIGAGTMPAGGYTGEKGHLRVNGTALEFHDGTAFEPIPKVSSENTTTGDLKVAVVTAMPATPDANTIYYVA